MGLDHTGLATLGTLVRRGVALARKHGFRPVTEFGAPFGEPPHRYFSARRMERAKILLAALDIPITKVALDLGFSTTSSFSAAFHRVTGQTPTNYRRSLE